MFIWSGIRERSRTLGALARVALAIFVCGAAMARCLAPMQEVEWRHIQSLPELDADSFAAQPTGQEVVITGALVDNPLALPQYELVAYQVEEWNVSWDDENDEYEGSWTVIETNMPALAVSITGGSVKTRSVSSLTIGGDTHEYLELGVGLDSALYEGRQLPDGSLRTRGFSNGDLVTVVGAKSSTGELTPERIYGGDRAQLVAEIRSGAHALFSFGLVMMLVCAPGVLIIGAIATISGRRRF